MRSQFHSRLGCPRFWIALAWVAVGFGLVAEDWPQWRGPDRLNASRETGLLSPWPTNGPPLIWRATGIGLGIHSVSVAAGRVFTIGNREGGEFVFALDARTGKKLWATRVDHSIEEQALMRWLTQRSPTVDGDRLYTLTANGELVCLKTSDGQRVWQRSYPKEFGARRPPWGFCDHPLAEGEWVIGSPFTTNATIAAFNRSTGEVVWKTAGGEGLSAGYAALVRSTAGGVPQLIQFHGRGLAGYAADDGRELWRQERPKTRIASTFSPIPRGDLVLSPNGYNGGLAVFKVVRQESGLGAELRFHPDLKLDPFQDCTAAVNGHLYLLVGGAPLCVEVQTGSIVWGNSTNRGPRAALTWADGHLYVRNAEGEMTLAKVSPLGTSIHGSFKIPEHEKSLGVTLPVVAEGRLWLRDNNRLFCYDVSAGALNANPPPVSHLAIGLTDRELGVDPAAPRLPRVGVNRAPDAVYVPTPQDVVERMLQEANLKSSDVFADLGSGDGRLVITAAKKYGCQAIGYEIDPRLIQESREALAREELGSRARVEHEDIFTVDLSGTDVITVFLYPHLMERLIPQFEKLKPGSRIISHQFELPGLKPDQTWIMESNETGDKHRILLWTTPLKRNEPK